MMADWLQFPDKKIIIRYFTTPYPFFILFNFAHKFLKKAEEKEDVFAIGIVILGSGRKIVTP